MAYTYPLFHETDLHKISESGQRYEDSENYRKLRESHKNVMILVGNGFDIRILKAIGSNKNTSYSAFYDYLVNTHFDPTNMLVKWMKSRREAGREWADFEVGIGELMQRSENQNTDRIEQLIQSQKGIQDAFVRFLQSIVTNEVLLELDKFAQTEIAVPGAKLSRSTLSLTYFLKDLDLENYNRIKDFVAGVSYYQVFNFKLINFNYTPLLDNYIHMNDSPHPYKTSDTFFHFNADPNKFDLPYSSFNPLYNDYGFVDIDHPHGIYTCPRSILFGVSNEIDYKDSVEREKEAFSKPTLARNNLRYKQYCDDSDLFIIFGCSLGESDKWWWENILKRVKDGKNLIIYQFEKLKKDFPNVRSKVLEKLETYSKGFDISGIENSIAVVPFNDDAKIALFNVSESV